MGTHPGSVVEKLQTGNNRGRNKNMLDPDPIKSLETLD